MLNILAVWLCTMDLFQALLIKWLILVYELLDSTKKFHMLYSFIFYFLKDEIIVSTQNTTDFIWNQLTSVYTRIFSVAVLVLTEASHV